MTARAASCLVALSLSATTWAQTTDNTENNEEGIDTVTSISPMRSGQQNTWQTDAMTPGKESGELLRDLLGVSGSRMGGHGTDPVIRGLGQTRLNVVMDGAMIQGACPNRMDPPSAYAPTSGYDTINITRGVASLARAAGPGGTIVFERNTERFAPGEPPRFEAHLGYRGNGAVEDAAFDVAAGQSTGYIRLLGSTMEADNYKDGQGQDVRSAFKDKSSAVLLGYTPTEQSELVISLDAQRLRDTLFAGAGMDSPRSDSETLRIKGRFEDIGFIDRLAFDLYRASVDHLMDNYSLRTPPNPMMRLSAPSTSDSTGLNLSFDQGPWQWGIDVSDNERWAIRTNDASGMLNSVLWPNVTIERSGVFGQWQGSMSAATELTIGARIDQTKSQATLADTEPAGMMLSPNQLYQRYYGVAASPQKDTHFSGLIRGDWRLPIDIGAKLQAYWTLSQTWRDADATERFIASNGMMPSMRWVGNPSIRAERHRQAEVGVFSQDTHWDVDFSLYQNEVHDFILRDRFHQMGDNATIYRNIDALLWGGEFALGYRFDNGWHPSLELSYVRGNNETDDRPLAQIPPLAITGRLAYKANRWQAGMVVRGASKQTRVDDNPLIGSGLDAGQTPAWAVLDLNVEVALADRWQFNAGIDNVFDRLYAQHLNRASAFDATQVQVNEPGRSAWVRLSYRR
ncbi:MAG: TonB-dependent copper receptor [Wenzhouxiangella sp.]|nr:TonB-dependent copper receptor [Wenzhouxiangella sp.]